MSKYMYVYTMYYIWIPTNCGPHYQIPGYDILLTPCWAHNTSVYHLHLAGRMTPIPTIPILKPHCDVKIQCAIPISLHGKYPSTVSSLF